MKDLLKEEWEKIKKEKTNFEKGKVGNLQTIEKNKEVNPDIKELLKQEGREQEIENYKDNEINWLKNDFYDDWKKVKGHMKNLFGHKEIYDEENKWKPLFLAHSKDTIKGKPLLISNCKVRLPLIRQAIKKEEEKNQKKKRKGNTLDIQSFYMLGEKFDKRHDGFQKDAFALDFYKYQIITPEDKEIFVFSQEKISSETSILTGMLIELDDYSEMSRTMKIPSLSRIFFCKDHKPSVKSLPPKELIDFVKKKKIDEYKWLTNLTLHPFGTLNNFPIESEFLHSAQMLSGKFDGYPLHVVYVGPQGTRKTMGKGETTEFKFSENKIIVDSGNTTIKGLGASHKGTILNAGYLAKQQRIAIVDELGKLVEKEINKSGGVNVLGEFNPIFEHKDRVVASGNTGESGMKPTAKNILLTNPVNNRISLGGHVGIIDPTFMSRSLWYVQDQDEQDFVLSKYGIIRLNSENLEKLIEELIKIEQNGEKLTPKDINKSNNRVDLIPKDINKHMSESDYVCSKLVSLKKSFGVDCIRECISRDDFLTIFDSCYSFNSNIDYDEIQKLSDMTSNLAKDPMRDVWKPRSFHHIFLLVDGICKQRCLFRDHDETFTAINNDYEWAERILIRMVQSWDTILTPKKEGFK
jgi:hypothetical protein